MFLILKIILWIILCIGIVFYLIPYLLWRINRFRLYLTSRKLRKYANKYSDTLQGQELKKIADELEAQSKDSNLHLDQYRKKKK